MGEGASGTRCSINELAGDQTQQLIIGCNDPGLGLTALHGHAPRAWRSDGSLCVELECDPRTAAAAVNRRLREAGVNVWHLELVRPTLEQRFLEITSRVGAAA